MNRIGEQLHVFNKKNNGISGRFLSFCVMIIFKHLKNSDPHNKCDQEGKFNADPGK